MTPARTAEAAVHAAEEQRRGAMLAADSGTLSQLASAALVYTHSDGARDTRDSYIEKVATGHFVYHSLAFDIDRVDIHAGVALVHGRAAGEVDVAGARRRLDCRYLAVWGLEEDAWRLRAFQPTPLRGSDL